MTIKQSILLIPAIVAIAQTAAMDQGQYGPYQQHMVFVNTGVLINNNRFSHYGSFINDQGIIVNNGDFTTGNIPQYHYPQYQYPQYQKPQHYYPQQPTYLPVAYGSPHTQAQIQAKHPRPQSLTKKNAIDYAAKNRPLTAQEATNIAEVEQFQPVADMLPDKLEKSVSTFAKLNQGEKAMVAKTLAPRLRQDVTTQDVKRVMHIFIGDSENLSTPTSSQKTIAQKSFFVGDPKEEIQSKQQCLWRAPAKEVEPQAHSFSLDYDVALSSDTKEIELRLEQQISTWDKLVAISPETNHRLKKDRS
jgi:hypothetical protein